MAKAAADFAASHGPGLRAWIEIDSGEHRTGVEPDDDRLIDIAAALADSPVRLEGVATHGGHSYRARDRESIASVAEEERAAVVRAAEALGELGHGEVERAEPVVRGCLGTYHWSLVTDGQLDPFANT